MPTVVAMPAPSRAPVARGMSLSLLLHAPALVWAFSLLASPNRLVFEGPQVYEVDLEREPTAEPATKRSAPPSAPEPEPEEAAEPETEAEPESITAPEPPAEPPPPGSQSHLPVAERARPTPAAAQAGRALTAGEASEDDVYDFTIVQGGGPRYVGGVTHARGTGQKATYDRNARVGGRGSEPAARTEPAPKPPPKKQQKQQKPPREPVPAQPMTRSWKCAFPAEADKFQVHFARVRLVVTVNEQGRAQSVQVLSDPGHGFADAARRCALRESYSPHRDGWGRSSTATTPPFTITFTR